MAVETIIANFTVADTLLLDEARTHFDFEQKLAVALQSKSTFFLTVATALSGLVGTALWRLLDRPRTSALEALALGTLLFALFALAGCIVLLARSSLSLKYQVVASPTDWRRHLHSLRTKYSSYTDGEVRADSQLRFDILDAWIEAADAGYINNRSKAVILSLTASILITTVAMAAVAILLLALLHFLR